MAENNSKQVTRKGDNNKNGITVMLAETISGEVLPMKLIYKGETNRSLPAVKFPAGFVLNYNEKHWSNEKEILKLIQSIICPYIKHVKKKLELGVSQNSLFLWDAFKAQATALDNAKLDELSIERDMVPKNMTHLLQLVDLATDNAMKQMENRAFSEYFRDLGKDITTIDADLKLST